MPLTMQVRAGSLNSCSALRYAVVSSIVFSSAFYDKKDLSVAVSTKSAKESVIYTRRDAVSNR